MTVRSPRVTGKSMILLTTSRRPTKRIRTFCSDLARSIPNTVRVNRGKMSLQELAENAVERGLDRIIAIDRWKGGPGKIRLYKMGQGKLVEIPPRIYVKGVRLQRELKKREKAVNSLAIGRQPEESLSEIPMLLDALSDFLSVPVVVFDEADSSYEAVMRVYCDDAQLKHLSFFLLPSTTEIGPHITISHLIWEN